MLVNPNSEYQIKTTDHSIKTIHPHFFGFNLEWVGFQEELYDTETSKVRSSVIQSLKAFPGAVYRYPGGTVANYFNWRESVGLLENRNARMAVDWRGPLVTRFGFNEYIDFVSEVKGQAWIVTNVYGDFAGETDITQLAHSAKEWSAEARRNNAKVFRWELGNELDRDRYRWPSEKYAQRAYAIASSILEGDPSAHFVAMLQDWKALPNTTPDEYNRQTSNHLARFDPDFAAHLYYDGPPAGPPIPHRLRQLCASTKAVKQGSGKPPSLWITEHARQPGGRNSDPDWKKNWHRTSNLEGAISVADMVIALSQAPEVEGGMLHSLSASFSPWPLFHKTAEGLSPSVVYWALRLLREDMLDLVLETRSNSSNKSKYDGGYDMRASLLTNHSRDKYTLWAVNRAGNSTETSIKVQAFASKQVLANITYLSDANPNANNALDGKRILPSKKQISLFFNPQGVASITLPEHSIYSLTFAK